jgi:hypothetical protein
VVKNLSLYLFLVTGNSFAIEEVAAKFAESRGKTASLSFKRKFRNGHKSAIRRPFLSFPPQKRHPSYLRQWQKSPIRQRRRRRQ